jgi:hypothetical protein
VSAFGVLLGSGVTQYGEQAQLMAFKLSGLGILGVVGGLEDGHGAGRSARERVAVPGVADAKLHRIAVGTPLHAAFGLRGGGDLEETAGGDLAHEHVAMANERGARMLVIEHGAAVGICLGPAIQFHALSRGRVGAVEVADLAAVTLEPIVDEPAVGAPIRGLHRWSDPVRVGHDLVDRERAGQGRCAGQDQCNGEGETAHA